MTKCEITEMEDADYDMAKSIEKEGEVADLFGQAKAIPKEVYPINNLSFQAKHIISYINRWRMEMMTWSGFFALLMMTLVRRILLDLKPKKAL